MNGNRITIQAIRESVGFDLIDSLTPEDFILLQEEVKERQEKLDQDAAFLAIVMRDKFKPRVDASMKARGEDTGTDRIPLGDEFELVAKTPKKVKWDESKLKAIWDRIVAHKDDPAVYIKKKTETTYSVSETAYKDWPEPVKAAFADARTVEPGKTTYTVERKEK